MYDVFQVFLDFSDLYLAAFLACEVSNYDYAYSVDGRYWVISKRFTSLSAYCLELLFYLGRHSATYSGSVAVLDLA